MAITNDEYKQILNQRWAQEDRLREAGVVTDGGGVSLLDGTWDIFVYKAIDDEMYDAVLSSVKEVDDYIASHGRAVTP